MKNFHIKSILLGIGIGIVLTSIISIVYLAGIDPAKSLSEEEIVSLAGKYGMVKDISIIKQESAGSQQTKDNVSTSNANSATKLNQSQMGNTSSTSTTGGTAQTTTQKTQTEKPVIEYVTVGIKPGDSSEMVSEKLFQVGLINNKNLFIDEMNSKGLSEQIEVGQYKLKKGAALDEIISKITGN